MTRTDLALEQVEQLEKTQSGVPEDGLLRTQRKEQGLSLTSITVRTREGARLVGKPMGRYITAEVPPSARAGNGRGNRWRCCKRAPGAAAP